MILKLLAEIRPLSTHKVLYDSYNHATHVMTILSGHTNVNAIIIAGLLHEVGTKLGEYKLKKCLQIIENSPYHIDLLQINRLLEIFSKANEKSKEEFAEDILSQGSSSVELLFLADTLSEVELTYSTIALENTRRLMINIIDKNLISKDDSLVVKINDTINNKLSYRKNAN